VTASFLNPLKRFYRHLLPVMPFALEQFDLRSYDLVISSESGPAKGVITGRIPGTSAIATVPCGIFGTLSGYLEWSGNPFSRRRWHASLRRFVYGTIRPPQEWMSSWLTAKTCAAAFGKFIGVNRK